MPKLKLVLDFDKAFVSSKADGWTLQLTRKLGHAYILWDMFIFYTEAELTRIHRHFCNLLTDRLVAVMRRADSATINSIFYNDLEKITQSCNVCQREANAPQRFRFSLPATNCDFNRTVSLDVMYLDGKAVLHVDQDTKFGATAFLSGEKTIKSGKYFFTFGFIGTSISRTQSLWTKDRNSGENRMSIFLRPA